MSIDLLPCWCFDRKERKSVSPYSISYSVLPNESSDDIQRLFLNVDLVINESDDARFSLKMAQQLHFVDVILKLTLVQPFEVHAFQRKDVVALIQHLEHFATSSLPHLIYNDIGLLIYLSLSSNRETRHRPSQNASDSPQQISVAHSMSEAHLVSTDLPSHSIEVELDIIGDK